MEMLKQLTVKKEGDDERMRGWWVVVVVEGVDGDGVEGWLEREGRTHDIIPSASLRGHSSGFSKCARRLLLRERLLLPPAPRHTRPEHKPRSWGGFKQKKKRKKRKRKEKRKNII